jgi:hypothetical protein
MSEGGWSGRWVGGWSPVADVAIALSKAEVSRGTDVVVGNDEFDVLVKICPRLVRMVGLCED